SKVRENTVMVCPAVRVLCAALVLAAGVLSRRLPDLHTGAMPVRGARLTIQLLAPTLMWTRYEGVRVRDRPTGAVLASLDIDQEVRVTGAAGAAGARWFRVRLWDAVDAWIRADLLAPTPVIPGSSPSGVPVAPHPTGPHAPMALHTHGVADGAARLRGGPTTAAPLLRILPSGAKLQVVAWATDSTGQAWYQVNAPASGWISADHVNLDRGTTRPSLAPVRGLGMWCTPPILDSAPPAVLIATAKQNHVTHLYVEVAGSHPGFYGASTLAALLPLAHRAHIAVIAWVYPFLDDVPRDVAIAVRTARYVAPTGDRLDGIMADVEQNMREPYVRAYSQVLRAQLGPDRLMAITTYAPQTYWGRIYPFRTVARSWDLVVPQDYWHSAHHAYTADQAYRFVAESIRMVRAAAHSPRLPVEALGQMFDIYQDGTGFPTAAEIRAAIRAARDGHTDGISFFEWNHATPDEWDALSAWNAPTGGTQGH
ncbi:MAG: SH3 domain-containing protein, partial [Chloroflexota bacterium]